MAEDVVLRSKTGLGMGRHERAVVRYVTQVQGQALCQRANDVARRDRELGRINDIGVATREAGAEGEMIIGGLRRAVERDPLAAGLAGIAEEGIDGIRVRLRALAKD
jgi:hypothetical protein